MVPSWVRWVWLTLGVLLAAYVATRVGETLFVLALALLLAVALAPLVERMARRGWPRGLATGLTLASLLALLGGLVAVVAPIALDQGRQALAAAPKWGQHFDWLRQVWAGWRAHNGMLPRFGDMLHWAGAHLEPLAGRVLDVPGQFLAGAFMAFTVLLLTFFFLKDGHALGRQVLALAPRGQRPELERIGEKLAEQVGRYVLGQLAVMFAVGSLTACGLWLVGVPYALLLGLVAGVLDVVPLLGPMLAAGPGLLLAFGQSWQTGVWAFVVYVVVQQVEGYGLYPILMGQAVALHPVWIVLALLLGGQLFGLAGLVLAVPAAVTLHVLLEERAQHQAEGEQQQQGPGQEGHAG